MQDFFQKIEKYHDPATILFRGIELKLLKQKFEKYLNKEKILDFGCGEGFAAAALFNHKISYGLDNYPTAITIAQNSKIYGKTFLTASSKIPLKTNSIDLVFVNCVFEHIKEINPALTEIFRITKKQGLLIFTVPSDNFAHYNIFSFLQLKPIAKLYGWLRNKKYSHHHCYSLKTWSLLLKKYNFKIINHFYYMNRRELELWDFFLFIRWPYQNLWKKIIHQKIINAQVTNLQGAAICIVAQKI